MQGPGPCLLNHQGLRAGGSAGYGSAPPLAGTGAGGPNVHFLSGWCSPFTDCTEGTNMGSQRSQRVLLLSSSDYEEINR